MGKRLESACLQSGRDIHTETLGIAGGDNVLWVYQLTYCIAQCDRSSRDVVNLLTAAYTAVSLNSIMQKPNESLHIFVSRYSKLQYGATDKTA